MSRYRRLGIEDSWNPLNAITEKTRASLSDRLALPVFTGMKHWTPHIDEAADEAVGTGAATIVGLVLAPHYSALSIAGYRDQLERALDGRAALEFVEELVRRPRLRRVPSRPHPRHRPARRVHRPLAAGARSSNIGDPYRDQLLETSALVAEAAAVVDWSFSFQSESPTGEPWLGPDILDHLQALHDAGSDRVLVCPVGFVSDHLEIRWDIDTEAREKAAELGMELDRIEMPNAEPGFVDVLAQIVQQRGLAPAGVR